MSGFKLTGSAWSGAGAGTSQEAITYDATTREVRRDGVVVGADIFEVLGSAIAEDPTATWVGYLGYACRADLRARPAQGVPDAVWLKAEPDAVAADGDRGMTLPRATSPRAGVAVGKGHPTPRPSSAYRAAFEEVQNRLRAGDSYEVNLTRRVDLGASAVDPQDVFARLCAINPAPYAAHLWHAGTHVVSASPECFLTIGEGRIRTKPIKGTTPRSADSADDDRQRELLANDLRYRAENLMITDLMRNDLSQVCVPGTVAVTGLMQVESYTAVHQLVSTIEGELRPGAGVVEAIRALFPAGSMTGAPKRRTMEIIDRVEDTPRGVYAGALGWIRGDACELSVVIRSLIRDPQGRWHAGTGGGITVHSDVASEWVESEWKLDRLSTALESEDTASRH